MKRYGIKPTELHSDCSKTRAWKAANPGKSMAPAGALPVFIGDNFGVWVIMVPSFSPRGSARLHLDLRNLTLFMCLGANFHLSRIKLPCLVKNKSQTVLCCQRMAQKIYENLTYQKLKVDESGSNDGKHGKPSSNKQTSQWKLKPID